MPDVTRFVAMMGEFARAMTGIYDVTDVLQDLCARTVDFLEVDGAGIMLEDPDGDLRFVVASDATVRTIEGLQIGFGEGPCIEAYRTGELVLIGDLANSRRYPRFGPPAVEAGIGGVYSFPLETEGSRIGAFNLYTGRTTDFGDDWQLIGRTLGDVAAALIVNARHLEASTERADQLEHALYSRVIIEQAKGRLAERHGVSEDDAYERIRDHARANNRSSHEVARDVLDGTLELGP